MKLHGVDEMKAKLRKIAANLPFKVGAALYREAEIEMTESKKRVPVDTGTLRASGMVSFPVKENDQITVTLSYGGAAKDYAIPVHENPDAFHPVGQWKYLESVLNESRPFMLERLAKRLDLGKD